MKFKALFGFILLFLCKNAIAQKDTVDPYTDLEVRKFYITVDHVDSTDRSNFKYFVDFKQVDKATYDKYAWRRGAPMDDCCPCLAKMYTYFDEKEQLRFEQVACGSGCRLGLYKSYDKKGRLEHEGQYVKVKNIKKLYDPRYDWTPDSLCNVKDGKWTYYKRNGDTLLHEYWVKGKFLKQVPEQKKPEIWDFEFILDNKVIRGDAVTLALDQIKNIKIKEHYKNKRRKKDKPIWVYLELHVKDRKMINGYPHLQKQLWPETIQELDVNKWLEENKLSKEQITYFALYVSGLNHREWLYIYLTK